MSKKDRKKIQPLQEVVPHVPERKKKANRGQPTQGGRPAPGPGPKPARSPVPPDDHQNPPALMTPVISGAFREPLWAAKVRESFDAAEPVGPPPTDIPPALEDRLNLDAPFVELTLVHTGPYTGPTRGRVVGEDAAGFDFLTNQNLYFVTWANLAYWTYLSEG